jgi:Flp pilus assembly protein TadG
MIIRRLHDDRSGATIIEFALILPVLMTLICGAVEIGHMLFARVMLEGAVVDAARIATASLESSQSQRDAAMRASIATAMRVFPIQKGKTITIQTKVFHDFSTASPETYLDANKNGKYDLGETYTDRNKNNVWDAGTPVAGSSMGGAGDVVSITATYPKQVMFGFLVTQLGLGSAMNLSATTVVRNEAVERTSS